MTRFDASEVESQKIFSVPVVIVTSLLIISVILTLFGLFSGMESNRKIESSSDYFVEIPQHQDEQDELSNIFDEKFSKEEGAVLDEYSFNDPFREVCVSAGGGEAPAINSYTVCYR